MYNVRKIASLGECKGVSSSSWNVVVEVDYSERVFLNLKQFYSETHFLATRNSMFEFGIKEYKAVQKISGRFASA